MNVAEQMGYRFPQTTEERRAGMAQFRARLLAAKERALTNGIAYKRDGSARPLTTAERKMLEDDCARIRAAQVKFGEV